jgi:TrmH family RNA methyltransferase
MAVPLLTPRECAHKLTEEATKGPVALLFGRERTGLTNEELERCHHLVHIPCNPEFSSLNIAAATQVLSYELLIAAQASQVGEVEVVEQAGPAGLLPASADQMARLYSHLQDTLIQIGFLNPEHPRHLMRRLKHMFNRAQPDEKEVNILRGILTAVEKSLKPPK